MENFRFLSWKVYEDSQKLLSLVLHVVKSMPREYRYELGSQLIRSALSVVLNIAEGSGKSSDKELSRYLNISQGSLYETLASADALKRNKLLNEDDFNKILSLITEISKQIGGFKKKIKSQ